MAYALQQIVVPVAVLGAQPDPAAEGDSEAWLAHFVTLIAAMSGALPCKFWVRLSEDVAGRMYGSALPSFNPMDPLPQITQCGFDRLNMTVFLDRALPPNTVRLE